MNIYIYIYMPQATINHAFREVNCGIDALVGKLICFLRYIYIHIYKFGLCEINFTSSLLGK